MRDELFCKLISWSNFCKAFKQSERGRRWKDYILKFNMWSGQKLGQLRQEIILKTYIHGNYYTFVICDSKKRTIWAAPFKDRIVHHALCNILEPIFERSFIFDNYACRVGKGSNRAILRLQQFLKVVGGG